MTTERLTVLAPGKVNLCLYMGGLRPDGRHELVTVFESVSLADRMTVTRSRSARDEVVCPGVEGSNLVSLALEGLRAAGWEAPPVRIEIEKRVPVAAGMGGGSGDAAAMLRTAGELAPMPRGAAERLARELGSDAPGQLVPGVAVGTGAGEIVQRIRPLAHHALVIVPLPTSLSTPEVYAEADRLGLARAPADLERAGHNLAAALSPGVRLDRALLVNDLEAAAISLRPRIAFAIASVFAAGVDHAMVSGSGPTVFGICWGAGAEERAGVAAKELQNGYPGAVVAVPVGPELGHPVHSAQSES